MKLTALILLLLLLGGLGVFALAGPELLSIDDPGQPLGIPLWTLFNPLRDRSPESFADSLQSKLRSGAVAEALAEMSPPNELVTTLAAELEDRPLHSWELAKREEKGGRTVLYYVQYREGTQASESFAVITLERGTAPGRWRLSNYWRCC